MTVETIGLPEPLLHTNGRRVFDVGDDSDGLVAAVITAPGRRLYIAGHYESHYQIVDIDPDYLPNLIDVLEQARLYGADGREVRPVAASTVIGALRLALFEGWAEPEKAIDVARKILEVAAPTPGRSNQPVALLVELLRDGELAAKVTTGVAS